MNIEFFNESVADVIKWNSVARDFNESFAQRDIDKQTEYVDEEILEAIKGFAESNIKEVLDGLADVFVTASYKMHMIHDGTPELLDDGYVSPAYTSTDFKTIRSATLLSLSAIAFWNMGLSISGSKQEALGFLFDMLNDFEFNSSYDMSEVISRVSTSNWSKYPIYDPNYIYPAECLWIEQNRNKSNVAWNLVVVDGIERVVFKDDYGNGKIVKPSSFEEPNFDDMV